ncbi:MAG: nicotinate-nucleotide adenylyltransferase [Tissierellia bacterium]|nr:nicotinate-nucleotide adenylyltransferase [Tissierellia bacterium]
MEKTKIGIMGGTFDPIHNGHLIIAENSRINFDLEEIIFIPTGIPAHKLENRITYSDYRYEMVLLSINSNPYFSLSSMEIERNGITYTIDTIKKLQKLNKKVEYYFIIGEDSLYNIHTWKDYSELLNICKFIVAKRKSKDNNLETRIRELNDMHPDSIYLLESPRIDISSTDIRNSVIQGKSIKYLVPEAVELYIKKHRLYGGEGIDRELDV